MKNFFSFAIFLITAMTVVDFAMTHQALSTPYYHEANPFSRWYVDHPALVVPLFMTSQGGASFSLAEFYKQNRTLAWYEDPAHDPGIKPVHIIYAGTRSFIERAAGEITGLLEA